MKAKAKLTDEQVLVMERHHIGPDGKTDYSELEHPGGTQIVIPGGEAEGVGDFAYQCNEHGLFLGLSKPGCPGCRTTSARK